MAKYNMLVTDSVGLTLNSVMDSGNYPTAEAEDLLVPLPAWISKR